MAHLQKMCIKHQLASIYESFHESGLNETIGATRAIEGSAYWIVLVVSWMQTLGSQPVMRKISPITGIRGLPKP
jgi:hypothetical protein